MNLEFLQMTLKNLTHTMWHSLTKILFPDKVIHIYLYSFSYDTMLHDYMNHFNFVFVLIIFSRASKQLNFIQGSRSAG